MDLNEAYNLFNKLLIETNNKAEIKVYKRFVEIFNNLKNREFSNEQLKSIEGKLVALKFSNSSRNRLKQYKLQFNELLKYLKEEFSLTPKGYYTSLGITIGAACGVMLGVLPIFWKLVFGIETDFQRSLGVAFGTAIGTFIGIIVGKYMDYWAEKRNRVLR